MTLPWVVCALPPATASRAGNGQKPNQARRRQPKQTQPAPSIDTQSPYTPCSNNEMDDRSTIDDHGKANEEEPTDESRRVVIGK